MARVGRVCRLRRLCPVAADSDGDIAQPFCALQATIPGRRFEKASRHGEQSGEKLGGTAGISEEIEHYYSRLALWVPSGLLSFIPDRVRSDIRRSRILVFWKQQMVFPPECFVHAAPDHGFYRRLSFQPGNDHPAVVRL